MNNKENTINELDQDGKNLVELHVYDLKNRINISALKAHGIADGLGDKRGKVYKHINILTIGLVLIPKPEIPGKIYQFWIYVFSDM